MLGARADMSMRNWGKLAQWTVFGTLGCVTICISINYVMFRSDPAVILNKALISSTLLPIMLAGPLFFFLSLKLRELAIANHRLAYLAATDSLTGCLNRRAFTKSVENCLNFHSVTHNPIGALLVIDADHFKAINDRFGHHRGDEALTLLAKAITGSLRKNDELGRLGGEEFAVFLQHANMAEASLVAERIRKAVNDIDFKVNGEQYKLSVSIGGAACAHSATFANLFRLADEQLYIAKNGGRNRIEMICNSSQAALTAASASLH